MERLAVLGAVVKNGRVRIAGTIGMFGGSCYKLEG